MIVWLVKEMQDDIGYWVKAVCSTEALAKEAAKLCIENGGESVSIDPYEVCVSSRDLR